MTSREIGYDQAPLDRDLFEKAILSPFNESQIYEYVQKWFALDSDLNPSERELKTKKFIDESKVVIDLISNPLMLSLICNIYKGENYIPKNKPEVYAKCSKMLFQRWDNMRGIKTEIPFKAYFDPTLAYLANWIYSNKQLQSGVIERDLVKKTTEYLFPTKYDDIDEANLAAQSFIDFCKGRAWIFTDVGSKKDGQLIFQFTHRTFLEYYTSVYKTRLNPTPDTIFNNLINHIESQEIDVVSHLAFQIISLQVENGGDHLINLLLDRCISYFDNKDINTLYFCVRCLEYIVPNPKTTRRIVEKCIDFSINTAQKNLKDIKDNHAKNTKSLKDQNKQEIIRLIFESLFRSNDETIDLIIKTLFTTIETKVLDEDEQYRDLYLNLLFNIDWPIRYNELMSDFKNPIRLMVIEEQEKIIQKIGPLINSNFISENDINTHYLIFNNLIGIDKIIDIFGNGYLFKEEVSCLFPPMRTSALMTSFLLLVLRFSDLELDDRTIQKYKEVLNRNLSLVSSDLFMNVDHWDLGIFFSDENLKISIKDVLNKDLNYLDPPSIFGLFQILAFLSDNKADKELMNILNVPIMQNFKIVLNAKRKRINKDKLLETINSLGLNNKQNEYIKNWVNSKINLPKIGHIQ